MKTPPGSNRLNFDAWVEARISKLSPPRREKVVAFVEKMKLSRFSPWSIRASIMAVLTLGVDGKPYGELTREDLTARMMSLEGYSGETIRSYRARV